MKTKIMISLILSVLIFWAGNALAVDPAKMHKIPMIINMTPVDQYQSDPMDSVFAIKGRIDMGTTDYYSVEPVFAPEIITIDGQPLMNIVPEIGLYKMDVFPQLKSSASAGWTIYFCALTGSNPDYWEKFKAMNSITMTSTGYVKVKYQQNGSEETVIVRPGPGIQITKPIGPVRPK